MPNKEKWHLMLLPEDDKTRQFGNGLLKAFPELENCVQMLRPARGCSRAIQQIPNLQLGNIDKRRVVLLIDLDRRENRVDWIKCKPELAEFSDRIFVIGCRKEVENLREILGRRQYGNLEEIGKQLASDCSLWDDPLLVQCKDDACRLKAEIGRLFQ